MTALQQSDAITIESWLSEADQRCLAKDVLHGLTRPLKELPPKHFYDSRGSDLFEQICKLPEYYPTRAETAILNERAVEIVALTGAGELVELGSGATDRRACCSMNGRGRHSARRLHGRLFRVTIEGRFSNPNRVPMGRG